MPGVEDHTEEQRQTLVVEHNPHDGDGDGRGRGYSLDGLHTPEKDSD